MSDEDTPVGGEGSSNWKWILLAVAVIYAAGSLYFLQDVRTRAAKLERGQQGASAQIAEVTKRVSNVEGDAETLASQVGMTKKELAARTANLQQQQRVAEKSIAAQKEQISAVSGEVAGVKTEVGGVKTDLGSTKTDLESTKAKLERTIGDLGVQSGLIAHTRDDLDTLKHRGDRNYYEFTLVKGAKSTPVSTVSLQLKKTDPKKSKFTLSVLADDRSIEKKDRNINEPMQFYTGRERMLYELVIWTVDKNKAAGYLSTPKAAPTPVQAQQ